MGTVQSGKTAGTRRFVSAGKYIFSKLDGSNIIENPKLVYGSSYYPVSGYYNEICEVNKTNWHGLFAAIDKKYVVHESKKMKETTKILFLRIDRSHKKIENCS